MDSKAHHPVRKASNKSLDSSKDIRHVPKSMHCLALRLVLKEVLRCWEKLAHKGICLVNQILGGLVASKFGI